MAGPYGTPRTWAAGERPAAAQFNAELRDWIAALANPPACRLTNSVVQAIGNNAWAAHTFDTELFDTDGMHSSSSNTSRITINTAGLYLVQCTMSYAANATGARGLGIRKNSSGANVPTEGDTQSIANVGTNNTFLHYSALVKLAVTDYVELVAFQSSGGALNNVVVEGVPIFSAVRLGNG